MVSVYTKEQIDSIGQKLGEEIKDLKGIYDSNSQTRLEFWVGTQAEYDLIVAKDPQTLYWVTYE